MREKVFRNSSGFRFNVSFVDCTILSTTTTEGATCPYITNGLRSYTFYATGETRSITSHITCNTKNVIYMDQCNRCNLQYIGETKRRLKDRFNEHRRAVMYGRVAPSVVFKKFRTSSRFCGKVVLKSLGASLHFKTF